MQISVVHRSRTRSFIESASGVECAHNLLRKLFVWPQGFRVANGLFRPGRRVALPKRLVSATHKCTKRRAAPQKVRWGESHYQPDSRLAEAEKDPQQRTRKRAYLFNDSDIAYRRAVSISRFNTVRTHHAKSAETRRGCCLRSFITRDVV